MRWRARVRWPFTIRFGIRERIRLDGAMRLVDISGWKVDGAFSPYPEGSRDKYALLAPDVCESPGIVPGHRYLMKFSNGRYPVQFWSEIIANVVGDKVGIPTPPAFVALDPETGQPGSLIEWFYGPRLEFASKIRAPSGFGRALRSVFGVVEEVPKTHSLYVPGSNYMNRTIPSYDLRTGTQHNLSDIGIWISLFGRGAGQDYWIDWSKIILFDALIGNTDRHQDNWGVLWRTNENGEMVPRFAPAFDNGTALAHEIMEERLDRFASEEAIDRYVRRGRHHMKWHRDDPRQCGHFELVSRLATVRPRVVPGLQAVVQQDFDDVYLRIRELRGLQTPVPLSAARADVICRMIESRVQILRKELAG